MQYTPAISVIMPVFNAGKFVGEAIKSILNQTYHDFEFIIINDGSIDNSLEIIHSFKDPRIKILNNASNIGNYPSRNKGLVIAQGKYICVMDADDYALGQRLERQYLYMEEHLQIGLAGSGFRHYGNDKDIFREGNYERIKVLLFRNICFIHPTLIIRSDLLKKSNLKYDEKYYYAADYDLIVRAARVFPVTNIPEVLLSYRLHENQISSKNSREQHLYTTQIAIEQLRFIGINPKEDEIQLHTDFIKGRIIDYNKKQLLHSWIDKVLSSNQKMKYYQQDELDSFFDALLSMQTQCRKSEIICRKPTIKMMKADLSDVTFLIPMRIDSQESKANIDTVLTYLLLHFKTRIIVLEADSKRNYFPENEFKEISYEFIKDNNELFHRTKWINKLLLTAETPFVAVWAPDAISPVVQIINAINVLRSGGKNVMSLPYDGRYYICDQLASDLFNRLLDIEVFIKRVSSMQLVRGYHCSGGAFLVNKDKYINAGRENENIYGSELEDDERVKRLEVMGLPVFYSEGPLFRLWQPKSMTNQLTKDIEIHNRREFIEICKKTHSEA